MNEFSCIKKEIDKAEKIVVLNHINMDGDAVGSAFSFAAALRGMGKSVTVLLEEEPPAYLRLICDDYALKTDEEFDLAVAVDCGDMGRLGGRAKAYQCAKRRVCIDHHVSNGGFGDVNYIKPEASSTCEIMYELLMFLTGTIEKRQAEQLYAGIITDTGGFKFSNTTPESLEYSADILRRGAEINKVCISIYETESLSKLKLKSRALNSIELYAGGKVSSIILTQKDFDETEGTLADCEGFSGIGRGIEGVEASFCMTVTDKVKVSLRSKQYVDVSKVAAVFGGGGHVRASGFSLSGDTDTTELKKTLVKMLTDEVEAGI